MRLKVTRTKYIHKYKFNSPAYSIVMLLTTIGFTTSTCICKFNAMLIYTPAYTDRIMALGGLVEALHIAIGRISSYMYIYVDVGVFGCVRIVMSNIITR